MTHSNSSRLILLVSCLVLLGTLPSHSQNASQDSFPSYHPGYPPPPDWQGPVFKLSQDYPAKAPPPENVPWSQLDPRTQTMQYLRAVLDYSLEGNVEVDFRGQENKVRTWYHAPWMQTGCAGREFIHGITRERRSRPFELHPDQKDWAENWAVGLYNPPGGFVVGKFWPGPSRAPVPLASNFPQGTVSLKLLFTAADPKQVPYVASSYTWKAHIYDNSENNNPCSLRYPYRPREVRDVRLLQVDVAVRDRRAGTTGWVFGTFVYSAAADGESPFDRLVPVGASWGDDSGNASRINESGAFVNPNLRQSVLNADLLPPSTGDWGHRAYVTHFGLGGRLNGPVDNLVSSCISCHARATVPAIQTVPSGVTRPDQYTRRQFDTYFATIPQGPQERRGGPGEPARYVHTDYSLQLAFGAQNWIRCINSPSGEGCPAVAEGAKSVTLPDGLPMDPGVPISRDEGDE